MNLLLQLPFSVQAIFLFLIGAVVGGQMNRGIYGLAWNRRQLGPWTAPLPEAATRLWRDRLPIVGWFGLRRESELHGSGYWFRPLLIELFSGLGFIALFWWDFEGKFLPGMVRPPAAELVWQFASHLMLFCLLTVATFIDIDEKTIPDAITIPGTLAGLVLATWEPRSLLPIGAGSNLLISSPQPWNAAWDGTRGLALGLACFGVWCFALLPKTWWTRSGPVKAVRYLWASMVRTAASIPVAIMAIIGTLVIVWVWSQHGVAWQGLLTGLTGLGFGGALIWLVRIVAGHALGKEAMGFGDVTLMAMIGTFVGWQSSMIVFFLAPFAGAVIAGGQWLVTRRPDIAYGPFLAVATVVLVIAWHDVWEYCGDVFNLGGIIPLIFLVGLMMMAVMLLGWRWLKEMFLGQV